MVLKYMVIEKEL